MNTQQGKTVHQTIQPPLPQLWLTAAEAAQYLKVKTRTILSWAREKQLKGYTLSGTERHVWRFLRADLDDMLLSSFAQPASQGARLQ